MNLYPEILMFKAQVYLLLEDFNAATTFAEKAWFDYGSRNGKLFKILTRIYIKTEIN